MRKKTAFTIFTISMIAILAAFSVYDSSPVKQNGDRLIVAFGDSLTDGAGDEKGSGYIGTLEKKLNDQQKEEFDFTNEAIYGLESSGVLEQLADLRVTRKLDEADYFIVFIGTNDLLNSNGGTYKNINLSDIERGQEIYLQNLKAIIEILQEKNESAPILLLGLYNPYPDSAEIESIIDEWNKAIKAETNGEKAITFIPTNDLFKGKDKKDYFSDSLHLNDQGYKVIADRIVEKYNFK